MEKTEGKRKENWIGGKSIRKVRGTVPNMLDAAKRVGNQTLKGTDTSDRRKRETMERENLNKVLTGKIGDIIPKDNEKRKETLAKVLVGKTGAAIPACVKAKERVGEKLKATVPKYVNAAKGKLKLAKDWIEATHLFTDTLPMMYLEYKMQERIEKKRESS